MRINHNIQALNAYRNLSQTMASTSKSLEKLSSGLRINKAADDAAGLAISEKMRSQIRGLDMAERNTLDAISLIQTGEGALNEVHSILQRMRELSVQAANGTLETQDREAIQSEIDQLTKEIDRIADTTQFNQKVLFSGSEEGRMFANVSSEQVEYMGNGVFGGLVTAEPTEPAKMVLEFTDTFGKLDKSEVNGSTFTINGLTYEVYSDDTLSAPENGNIIVDVTTEWVDPDPDTDADAIENINHLMDKLTDAIAQNDSVTFDTEAFGKIVAEDNLDDADGVIESGKLTLVTKDPMSPKDAAEITITEIPDDVKFLKPDDLSLISDSSVSLQAADTASYTNSFNITFSDVPKDGDSLQIDELTFTFKEDDCVPYNNGAMTIDIRDKDIFTILSEIDTALNDIKKDGGVLAALSSHNVVGSTLVLATDRTETAETFGDSSSNGLEVALFDGNFEANRDKALDLTFQIGANSSESLSVSINVMDAGSLGIGRDSNGNPVEAGINAEHGVDVMSVEAAQRAIELIDNAVTIVSAERSKLGAIQNRLEHTTNNLQTASENLTSAESRIRDVDMADEMTKFTRNNILNQAGQAMLAQANQLPQGILQLLQ